MFEFPIPGLYLEFELCNKENFFHGVSNLENKVNVIAWKTWLISHGSRQMKKENFCFLAFIHGKCTMGKFASYIVGPTYPLWL